LLTRSSCRPPPYQRYVRKPHWPHRRQRASPTPPSRRPPRARSQLGETLSRGCINDLTPTDVRSHLSRRSATWSTRGVPATMKRNATAHGRFATSRYLRRLAHDSKVNCGLTLRGQPERGVLSPKGRMVFDSAVPECSSLSSQGSTPTEWYRVQRTKCYPSAKSANLFWPLRPTLGEGLLPRATRGRRVDNFVYATGHG